MVGAAVGSVAPVNPPVSKDSITARGDAFDWQWRLSQRFQGIGVTAKIAHAWAILIVVLAFGHVNHASAGDAMKLSEHDLGKNVEVRVGDKLEIAVPGNPTTGYAWEVISFDSNTLRQGNMDFRADDKVIGAGGMEIISFDAIAEGTSEIRLVFRRPFEPTTPPLKTFEVTVIVKK